MITNLLTHLLRGPLLEREIQRKGYLNGLFNRSPQVVAQEEALYIECKRIEQNERRFQRQREDLIRTLGGVESGLQSLSLRLDDPTSALPPQTTSNRRQKRGDGMDPDSPMASTSSMNMIALPSPSSGATTLPAGGTRYKSQSLASSSGTPAMPGSISLSGVAPYNASQPETTFDPVNCMTQLLPSSAHPQLSATKAMHKPVTLRSSLIPIPKAPVLSKINTILTDLGIHPSRLVMPTAANIERMEALQQAAGGLADMKRLLDKVEQDVKNLKTKLRGESEAAETDAGGAGDGDRAQTGDREMSTSTAQGDKRVSRSTQLAVDVDLMDCPSDSQVRVHLFFCGICSHRDSSTKTATKDLRDFADINSFDSVDALSHHECMYSVRFFVIKPPFLVVLTSSVPLVVVIHVVVINPLPVGQKVNNHPNTCSS